MDEQQSQSQSQSQSPPTWEEKVVADAAGYIDRARGIGGEAVTDAPVERQWRAVMSELREIERRPWPHIGRELAREPPRGYVYAVTDCTDGRRVYINWAGRTRLREALGRLQAGNPDQLRVVAILRRDNAYDAKMICETMHAGLMLCQLRGNWFEAKDESEVVAAFGRVDRLEPEPVPPPVTPSSDP